MWLLPDEFVQTQSQFPKQTQHVFIVLELVKQIMQTWLNWWLSCWGRLNLLSDTCGGCALLRSAGEEFLRLRYVWNSGEFQNSTQILRNS